MLAFCSSEMNDENLRTENANVMRSRCETTEAGLKDEFLNLSSQYGFRMSRESDFSEMISQMTDGELLSLKEDLMEEYGLTENDINLDAYDKIELLANDYSPEFISSLYNLVDSLVKTDVPVDCASMLKSSAIISDQNKTKITQKEYSIMTDVVAGHNFGTSLVKFGEVSITPEEHARMEAACKKTRDDARTVYTLGGAFMIVVSGGRGLGHAVCQTAIYWLVAEIQYRECLKSIPKIDPRKK